MVPKSKDKRRIRRRELWLALQEIIGNHKFWPVVVRMIIWRQHISHFDRIVLSSFVFVNGLPPNILIEFLLLVNFSRNSGELEEIVTLLRAFESDPHRYTYYAYSVTNRRYEYLSGGVRLYHKKENREEGM